MGSKIKLIETYFPKNFLSNDMISQEFPKWNPEKSKKKLA